MGPFLQLRSSESPLSAPTEMLPPLNKQEQAKKGCLLSPILFHVPQISFQCEALGGPLMVRIQSMAHK